MSDARSDFEALSREVVAASLRAAYLNAIELMVQSADTDFWWCQYQNEPIGRRPS